MKTLTEQELNEVKDRFCGYCNRILHCSWKDLLTHTIKCEIDCVDRLHY